MNRLPAPYGSRIDRSRTINFTFEGRPCTGLAGDSIASALAASGQWVLSRSFKYHRPRGILSLAGGEANGLVQLPGEPNVLAEHREISEGLTVTAQNVNGGLEKDRDAILDRFGRFLPVGFYYRTFMGPRRSSWLKRWEPMIRAKAGLGKIDVKAGLSEFDSSYLHCDLLVVGAGLAGLSAAVAAARAGADVLLCDENPELGGACVFRGGDEADLSALIETARRLPGLRIMTRTVCNGWFEDNYLALIEGQTLHRTRAREVVFAVGTIEQPAIFRNNDLPGILLAGAAQRLIQLYGVRPGKRAVVLAADADGYTVAADLARAGVEVVAIVDPRPEGGGEARQAGIEILHGATIEEARGTAGGMHLSQVKVGVRWIACDLLVVCNGSVPAWQLPCQAGGKLRFDEDASRFRLAMPEAPAGLAGAVNGYGSAQAVIADGRRAARAALARLGRPCSEEEPPITDEAPPTAFETPIQPHAKGRDFVDFDEDLQVKDIVNAVQEGYRELELVKRFSTVGMGPSQGRHSALATARIVAQATARTVGEVGFTTARPPTGPETLGVLAGHHSAVERRTALHARHLALDARMRPVGGWRRPYFYGPAADSRKMIVEEIAAVRQRVGLLDVSTLGKLEVRGPEAGAFLDRLYTTAHAHQPIGRVRYGLMLNEMGSVIDDGVAFRLAEDRFYVTSTTGAVARVYAEMLFWNARWRMNVDVLNLTSAFSGLNITGPAAREVLESLDGEIDFSKSAFKYMDGREGEVSGVPVRAMRIGFTGELSYELHCPSSLATPLWDAIVEAGKRWNLRPYGVEASRILRLEKRHILIGQDTDALTTPNELGFGWAVSTKKPFFVGKRSLEMRARLGENRRLVGFRLPSDAPSIPEEGCLVLRDQKPVGQITSIGRSPTLDCFLALAYAHSEDAAEGARITMKCADGAKVEALVESRAFFDPDNLRQGL